MLALAQVLRVDGLLPGLHDFVELDAAWTWPLPELREGQAMIAHALALASDPQVQAAIQAQITKNGYRKNVGAMTANSKSVANMTPQEKDAWLAKRRAFAAKYRRRKGVPTRRKSKEVGQ